MAAREGTMARSGDNSAVSRRWCPVVAFVLGLLVASSARSTVAQTACPDNPSPAGAALTISPAHARPGDTITIAVSGAPGERAAVAVSLSNSGASYRGQPLLLGTALEVLFTCQLGGSGACSESFSIAAGITGTFHFQAGRSSDPTFQGGTFSPTNGACLAITDGTGRAPGTPSTPSPPGAPIPGELVGEWNRGGVSASNFYNPTTGAWSAPSGSGTSWKFNADGAYEHAGLLQQSRSASCTFSFFSYREIGDISLPTQAKLLRVLQERSFERVGGTETIKVDVRLLAATNKDLRVLMEQGKFREDLFYRLNVVPLAVPPLRERVEDIPLLVTHFLARFNREYERQVRGVTPQALRLLSSYHWPGNVRELQNCLENMVALAKSDEWLTERDLPPNVAGYDPSRVRLDFPVGVSLDEIEKQTILRTLEAFRGNKRRAAEVLGIGLKTLYRKLEEYAPVSEQPQLPKHLEVRRERVPPEPFDLEPEPRDHF
jgi:hypothetical protein